MIKANHSSTAPTKAETSERASTPNNASPGLGEKAISEKTIRKKLSFARASAAISRAGHRLTTPKRSPKKLDHLQQLVHEHEHEPEQPFSTIFSSPIQPELDKFGKPGCARYIADFGCGHQVIEQHPCQEHYPACCLDDGHFVTKEVEKAKMCQNCQNIEETKKLDAQAHANALEQWNNAKPQILYPTNRRSVSPQRRRALIAKERVARRIEALGPLPASSTSDLYIEGNDNNKSTETVYDLAGALQELEPGSGDGVTIFDNRAERSIGQTAKERFGSFVAAAMSTKGYPTATSRAVSGSGMLGAGHEGYRSVSESLRPLPPLPTPVNFDSNAMADKAYANSFHGSILNDFQSVAITTAEDERYEEREVYGTPPMRDDDGQSFTFNEEDDFESTLNTQDDNSVLASDPFIGDDRREKRASLVGPSERPLPPIPSDATRHNSMLSAEDEHELGFSTRSLQYWKDLDIPPPMQHSPTRPRQAPAPPIAPAPSVVSNPLATFDFRLPIAPSPPTAVDPLSLFDFGFEQEYSRGERGYTGRMGQKGAGDDFTHDWRFEHPSRNYSQDETATGDLWENKHGFGYAGLKRHLQKQAEMRKQKRDQESKQNKAGKEDENSKKGSPNKRFSGDSFSYSSPRPNKESSIWARRWVRKAKMPLPEPMLYNVAGTGEVGADQKSVADSTTIVKSAKKEAYDGIPWDRTMIGCAL